MSRIFIISKHLMFGYGLECLLLQNSKIEVVGREANVGSALDAIRKLQPDTVIIDTVELSAETMADLIHVLNATPGAKIIQVSLQSNYLYIYEVNHTEVEGIDDLIEAIKGG